MEINQIEFIDGLRTTEPLEKETGYQVVVFSPFIKRPLGFPTLKEQIPSIKDVARIDNNWCLINCYITGFNSKNYKRQLNKILKDLNYENNRRRIVRDLIEDCDLMDIVKESDVANLNRVFNVQ